jgi:uncharacterized protein YkwD
MEPEGSPELKALIEEHNRERSAAGLPPLTANAKLEAAARFHAKDMAEHYKLTHDGSDGSTVAQRVERQGYHPQKTGENIAEGYESIPDVMKGWMNSPHHKANILGDFTEMGVARVDSEDGKPYWCVDFGRPYPKIDAAQATSKLVDAINAARSKAEKAPLKPNPKLEAAAQHHARDMAARGEFHPEDDDGLTPVQRLEKDRYTFQSYGELGGMGEPDAEAVVKRWLDNPSNREFLLGDFREIGVGCAASEKGVPFWSVLLAKPAR